MDSDCDEAKFIPDYSVSTGSDCTASCCSELSSDLIVVDECRAEDNEPHDTRTVLDRGIYPSHSTSLEVHTSKESTVRERTCPLCTFKPKMLKRHVIKMHLPWYVAATTACWGCQEQTTTPSRVISHTLVCGTRLDEETMWKWCRCVTGLLHFCRQAYNLDDLDDLLSYVVKNRQYPILGKNDQHFSPQEEVFMKHFVLHFLGGALPSEFLVSPPNHIICLVHWRIFTNLLEPLSADQREEFRVSNTEMLVSGLVVLASETNNVDRNTTLQFSDAHFHLDQLLKRSRRRNLPGVEESGNLHSSGQLVCAVANYVYPKKSWDLWSKQTDSRIHLSFGIHPHLVRRDWPHLFPKLSSLLKLPFTCAIGEVGIDLTSRCHLHNKYQDQTSCQRQSMAIQLEFLRECLIHAEWMDMTVILHCRDVGSGEASSAVLSLLRDVNLTHLWIHRHCFTGGLDELREWISYLPNVFFVFTALVRDEAVQLSAAKVPIEKLLLESDSPYLPFKEHHLNTPWSVLDVATVVAAVRNVPTSFILESASVNCRHAYRLC